MVQRFVFYRLDKFSEILTNWRYNLTFRSNQRLFVPIRDSHSSVQTLLYHSNPFHFAF